MTTHENIIIKAKVSISWIYSNILGKTVEAQLRTANEIAQARGEYISWVSHLLPIEQALVEFEELKRDVARFMVLLESNVSYVFLGTQDISDEFDELEDKLSKVGKEE